MKTLERYEDICMDYFNGNISDFRKSLRVLSKKEILVLEYNLAVRLRAGNSLSEMTANDWYGANNIIHKYL